MPHFNCLPVDDGYVRVKERIAKFVRVPACLGVRPGRHSAGEEREASFFLGVLRALRGEKMKKAGVRHRFGESRCPFDILTMLI